MEEFKRKWEEWYGDMLPNYQWCELDYNGRQVLYVCGTAMIDSDGRGLASNLLQVIGYMDTEMTVEEEVQREIAELLKGQHGIENISFWSE
ncbi:MAG: hypothetical protein JSW38_07175 [Dehalococcoidia bacterium]|nr:MAG: hypothetical protein JSV02_01060 [Dehalococcoidia bacterium]UCG81997.1 MAG: hypothetical protein JSW38_07175 [Dehalococcoidia bacterium]